MMRGGNDSPLKTAFIIMLPLIEDILTPSYFLNGRRVFSLLDVVSRDEVDA